jgi:hypothetical protein
VHPFYLFSTIRVIPLPLDVESSLPEKKVWEVQLPAIIQTRTTHATTGKGKEHCNRQKETRNNMRNSAEQVLICQSVTTQILIGQSVTTQILIGQWARRIYLKAETGIRK